MNEIEVKSRHRKECILHFTTLVTGHFFGGLLQNWNNSSINNIP